MASRGSDRDGPEHEAVMSNLMDIQARLRGDPASLVLPRGRRRDDTTTVRHDDVGVTMEEDGADPERRIESLRRRLEYLELEIDAYEQAADDGHEAEPATPITADVGELQHVVEERLTVEPDEPTSGAPATP
jgi:hypothetical protein